MKIRKNKISVILCSVILLHIPFVSSAKTVSWLLKPHEVQTLVSVDLFFIDIPYYNSDIEIVSSDVDDPDDCNTNFNNYISQNLNNSGTRQYANKFYILFNTRHNILKLINPESITGSTDLSPPFIFA
jgi:hypothetical protein